MKKLVVLVDTLLIPFSFTLTMFCICCSVFSGTGRYIPFRSVCHKLGVTFLWRCLLHAPVTSLSRIRLSCRSPKLHGLDKERKGPFTRSILVAIFLILTHAIEWLSHKSIDYLALHRWSSTFVSQSI